MPVIEFTGKTTEEAIESACDQLQLAKDELKFEIISTGGTGLLGLLTGQKAVIKVILDEEYSAPSMPAAPKGKKPGPVSTSTFGIPTPRARQAFPQNGKKRPARAASRRSDTAPRENDRQAQRYSEPEKPVSSSADAGISSPDDESALLKAQESLQGILDRMHLEGSVSATRNDSRIILTIQAENNGLLIGKKGATLDALQFLINKIVNRSRSERYRIIVDAGDYRQKRHESLVALAHRMADKARRTKRPVSINALSAHDRRIIHMTLKNKAGLSTKSKGDGAYKRIIILPKRASSGQRPTSMNSPLPSESSNGHQADEAPEAFHGEAGEAQHLEDRDPFIRDE